MIEEFSKEAKRMSHYEDEAILTIVSFSLPE